MRRHRAALGGAFTLLLCACDGTVAGLVPDASSDTPGGTVLGTGSAAGSSGALGAGLGGSTANPAGVAGSSASASVGGMAGAAVAGSGNVSAGGSAGSEPPVAGEEPVVELFQDCSYAGWQASLAVGEYQSADLEALGGVSHDASSLHVTPGFEVVLYSEDAFGGDSVVIDADTECLVAQNFNDLAASIVVRAATGGSGGTGGGGGSAGTSGSGGGGDDGGGGGTNTGGTGGSAEPDRYQRCVDRINEYRATEGRPALARRVDKEACADGQAKSDSETGTAHGAFNQCDDWAQNECPGWGSVDDVIDGCLQAMWDEGPGGGHYENMISDRTYVWCGFYITPGGKVWSVQDFK